MSDPLRTLARAIQSTRDFIDQRLLGLGRPDARYRDYPHEEMAALLEPAKEVTMAAKTKWVWRANDYGADLVAEAPTKEAAEHGRSILGTFAAVYLELNGWVPEVGAPPVEVQEQRVPRRKTGARRTARPSRAKGRRNARR